MAEELTPTSVTSRSTATPGRTLNTARHNHFVIDSPYDPAEALSTGEAFIAGIASCGVTLVQGAAKNEEIELEHLSVAVTSYRSDANPADFHHMDVEFTYTGPSLEEAEKLTEIWRSR
jgi:uncharacterized OsmC-like protein